MSKQALTSPQFKEMLLRVADAIIAAEPLLSEADRNLGDGDHGIGMQRGMEAVQAKLGAQDDNSPLDKHAQTMGMAMMSSMGGASGIVFGSLFMGGGKGLVGHETLTSAALASFLKSAAESVCARGKAKVGDKTMVDALQPAADKAAECGEAPLAEAATAIAAAGVAGREASKDMIATLGRAKSLGEGSLGFPDAGACSVAIILETIRDYILAE